MKDDDLFAETSMSFGEHLEELRLCFIRSLVSIAIGTILGFAIGDKVVKYIQIPVQRSLHAYHEQQGMQKIDAQADVLLREGYSSEIKTRMKEYGFVRKELWIFPGEIERIQNMQRILTGDSDDEFSLDNVDNLLLRKIERRERRESVGIVYDTVRLDLPPVRWHVFEKVEELSKMTALNPYEMFKMWILASFIVGLVIASPFVIYHLWSFVAAGLYPHEKKYVYYFIPVSVFLFIGGALFAFFFVFQFVLEFLFLFNSWMDVEPDLRISEWVSFALLFPLCFGISFQLPLVMFVLERVGIFTFQQYISRWRIAILVICVMALILTPGDPGSMLLMTVALMGLYFTGTFFCWLIPRKRGLFDADPEDA